MTADEATREEKKRLRKLLRALRDSSDTGRAAENSVRLCRIALALEHVRRAKVVSLFASHRSEADTRLLIEGIIQQKGFCVLPRTLKDGGLAFHRVTSFPAGCVPGSFGILEPDARVHAETVALEEIDLAFVPGLGFDPAGRRLGYGHGYFDRSLAAMTNATKLGLAFSFQIVGRLPEEAHDQRVQAIVTEHGFHPLAVEV